MRCTVTRVAGFKSPAGAALTGPERYQFNSGGPFVRNWQPSYGKIDEQQLFMLELNGPATPRERAGQRLVRGRTASASASRSS